MIENLLAYQKADAALREIEKKLSENEDRKKAIIAKKYLESVDAGIVKLESRAAKLVDEFNKMAEEQQRLIEQEEEFERAIDAAADKDEAAYLLKKVDELGSKIKYLMSKVEKISEEMASVNREFIKIKKETRAMQEQYKVSGKGYNEFKASFKDEREKIEAELKELAKAVDAGLMERYLKKRSGKMYPVVYAVRENVCGACNMELPMSELNKLKNGAVIDCDNCGRLLYKE